MRHKIVRQKKVVVLVLASMAALVPMLGATAFACTNLATLNLSIVAGKPGATVEVIGSSFLAGEKEESNVVRLQWGGIGEPVLAQTMPDSAGNVSVKIIIPEAPAGDYVLFASQRRAQDVEEYAALARAVFQVLGPGEESFVAHAAAEGGGSLAVESASTDMMALSVVPGVVGLVLFGARLSAPVRQARRGRRIAEPARSS